VEKVNDKKEIKQKTKQVRTVFLLWLPWLLRMSRPGKKLTRKTIMMNSRMKDMELKERSSRYGTFVCLVFLWTAGFHSFQSRVLASVPFAKS